MEKIKIMTVEKSAHEYNLIQLWFSQNRKSEAKHEGTQVDTGQKTIKTWVQWNNSLRQPIRKLISWIYDVALQSF